SASVSFTQTTNNARGFLEILVNNSYKWGQEGWGGHMSPASLINVNPLLTLEEANASIQPAIEYALAQRTKVVVEDLSLWQAFFTKSFLQRKRVGVQTSNHPWKPTDFADPFFTEEDGKEALVDLISKMINTYAVNPYIIQGTPFLYNSSTSAPPAWRNSLWQIGFIAYNATLETTFSQYEIVNNVTAWMRELAPDSGAYFVHVVVPIFSHLLQNAANSYEPDHEVTFWRENYLTLLQLKNKYNPDKLMDCWTCREYILSFAFLFARDSLVGWKGAADERHSCYLNISSKF
ncbi:hypothetical protein GYMLUDRAFT_997268, partial [Collybiopsis luxurians FD-317 M1]